MILKELRKIGTTTVHFGTKEHERVQDEGTGEHI